MRPTDVILKEQIETFSTQFLLPGWDALHRDTFFNGSEK